MALYLGSSEKLQINLNGTACDLKLYSETPVVNGDLPISSDGYVLRDLSLLYLTAKDGG